MVHFLPGTAVSLITTMGVLGGARAAEDVIAERTSSSVRRSFLAPVRSWREMAKFVCPNSSQSYGTRVSGTFVGYVAFCGATKGGFGAIQRVHVPWSEGPRMTSLIPQSGEDCLDPLSQG